MLLVSSVLSFKMGLFEDIKQQIVHDAVADESIKIAPVVVKTTTKKVETPVLVEKKENTKAEIVKTAAIVETDIKVDTKEGEKELDVFERKSDSEVKMVVDKYKDQISDSFITTVTSYNSEAGQTDDSPCIAASGMDVCKRNLENIIATNDLPFHTKVLIPEYFGDRIFYVEDRMNKRYTGTDHIDVWMKNKINSKNFGAKVLKIIVLK